MTEQTPITNMLASFSTMLSQLIDQRVTAHRMLAEAKRADAIGELVALKMKEQGMKADYALDVKMKSLIDERVRERLTEVLSDAVESAIDNRMDEALGDWMDDTSNVKQLVERLDIDEELGNLLEGRTMTVTITDR